jgi:hypothetical protein
MITVTVNLPDELAPRIDEAGENLSEIVAASLVRPPAADLHAYIVHFLASQPEPEAIRAFKPSAELQNRFRELVGRERTGTISSFEKKELAEFVKAEELIRMIKSGTLSYLRTSAKGMNE